MEAWDPAHPEPPMTRTLPAPAGAEKSLPVCSSRLGLAHSSRDCQGQRGVTFPHSVGPPREHQSPLQSLSRSTSSLLAKDDQWPDSIGRGPSVCVQGEGCVGEPVKTQQTRMFPWTLITRLHLLVAGWVGTVEWIWAEE